MLFIERGLREEASLVVDQISKVYFPLGVICDEKSDKSFFNFFK